MSLTTFSLWINCIATPLPHWVYRILWDFFFRGGNTLCIKAHEKEIRIFMMHLYSFMG